MSEATKEEAKGRFLRGDYMGAAKVRYRIRVIQTEVHVLPPFSVRPIRNAVDTMYTHAKYRSHALQPAAMFPPPRQKYVLAAETLDERPPPTHPRLEGLRGRLKDLYLACMCNAAVAGFKAAKAAPAPGEAHGLVVDACSKALARGGGKCPKVSSVN